MKLNLKWTLPTLALMGPWSAFAQDLLVKASGASGVGTDGRPPIVTWAVVVGVSAVVAAVVSYAVAKSVTSGSNSNN